MDFHQNQSQIFSVPAPAGMVHHGGSTGFIRNSPIPSAPSMDKIIGYEGTTFNGFPAVPPGYFESSVNTPPPSRPEVRSLPNLTEEQVRLSLEKFVNDHCCYGKRPLQSLKIVSLEPACAFHYTIETYAEKRETAWSTEPYDGQFLDGPSYGVAPRPWDIQVYNTIPRYEDGQLYSPVPHTSSIKQCHKCVGLGRRPCQNCMSMGQVLCTFCRTDSGRRTNGDQQICAHCNGIGVKMCLECGGIGQKTCDTCDGKMNLICYIKLTVTMKNHFGDYLIEQFDRSFLPQSLLKSANGTIVYEEDAPKIWPITTFPIPAVTDASRLLIQQHSCAFQNERVHCQRQKVKTIPVTEVICIYKEKEAKFYVYGLENSVYFPDYFEKCCCCCTLM